MYIFQRQMRVMGGANAVGWAMEVTSRVQEVTEMPVSLWMGQAGFPNGTLGWSMPTEGMAQVTEMNDTLQADDTLGKLITDHARDYVVEVMPDRMSMIIHGEITDAAPVGSFMGVVTANASEGNWGEAGAWAASIADMYSGITGRPAVVAATTAGAMGEYCWYVRHDDGASIDAATAAAMSNEEYGAELDRAGHLFEPGGTWRYARRIA